jgi:hypothetical protein
MTEQSLVQEPAKTRPSTDIVLQRVLIFLIVGVLISLLSGYVGMFALGSDVAALFGGSLLFAALANPTGALALLVTPATYGFQWAWPVTLILLPVLGLWMGQVTMMRLPIFVVGGLGGALAVFLLAKTGIMLINVKSLEDFMKAGALAGTVSGFLFGFVAWRVDYCATVSRDR